MAEEAEFDGSQLSPSQQEALEQYTMITDQPAKDAIPLLERSQWNAQIAIAKFFDGEGPDPVAEALASQHRLAEDVGNPQARLGVSPRFENLQDSFQIPMGARRGALGGPRLPRTEPAPRVVPTPTTTYAPPFLLSIIFAPFNLGARLVSTVFRSLFYVLSFIPRPLRPRAIDRTNRAYSRRQLMPRDSAARFRREFEETYGPNELPWFDGGSAQAYDFAKKELKFLLIVLISPEHDDTDAFVRDVLLHPELVAYLGDPKSEIVLWGGNVLDSEAYQVSSLYKCTMFPFWCLVALTPREGSTRMGTIKRSQGPTTAARMLGGIRDAIDRHSPDLDGVRAERTAQAAARSLRTEQDSAYERSLAKDREKARRRKEEEEAAAAAEKRALEEAERAALRADAERRWRLWRAAAVAPEPPASDRGVVRLALMMPAETGVGRVVRRFSPETTVEELYAFVECYGVLHRDREDRSELDEKAPTEAPEGYEHRYGFRIVSVMPREVYEPSEVDTLGRKIGRSGNLIVERVVDDDESGDEDVDKGEGEGAEEGVD